jgi:hypothetical protein
VAKSLMMTFADRSLCHLLSVCVVSEISTVLQHEKCGGAEPSRSIYHFIFVFPLATRVSRLQLGSAGFAIKKKVSVRSEKKTCGNFPVSVRNLKRAAHPTVMCAGFA